MNTRSIGFCAQTAVEQAYKTADQYFREAVRRIDEKFGDGYAKKNPRLVATFMQVAAKDFDTAVSCGQVEATGINTLMSQAYDLMDYLKSYINENLKDPY
jgi:hypothetical protein